MNESIKRWSIKLDMEYGIGDCEEVECSNGAFVRVADLVAILEQRRDDYKKFALISQSSEDAKGMIAAAASFMVMEQLLELLKESEKDVN